MATTHTWTISEWQAAYRQGTTPETLLTAVLAECRHQQHAVWITLLDNAQLHTRLIALAQQLAQVNHDLNKLPLYGIPFAVKDNIDVAGLPTTCACPDYAYTPSVSATVVSKLEAAGAVVLGKTNLDQFATGLVGTRSPYGVVNNAFNADYISGGSSSGSALAVAQGWVPFSLGTDTAGSGRVPAGFNNLVGLKPTRGWLSTQGVVPACRSLDCVSIFALTVDDADYVAQLAGGFDATDSYSRTAPAVLPLLPNKPVLGIPTNPYWFDDALAEAAFQRSIQHWQDMGYSIQALDFTPLYQIAALLYEGPWVAERYYVLKELLAQKPDAIHPVVRHIVEQGQHFSAVDTFSADYKRAELVRLAESIFDDVDVLLVPTSPSIYRIDDVLTNPVKLNSQLGTYTNFVNLLDLAGLAIPAGFRADGLPCGITLLAPAWQDALLVRLAKHWQQQQTWSLGASSRSLPNTSLTPLTIDLSDKVLVAVVGAHLTGMPLNYQLQERGAHLVETTTTANHYRFYALAGTVPPKPGLVKTTDGQGGAIAVEIWAMPTTHFGSFVALIPSPLGIGTLELADGRQVKGFICEAWATANADDITHFGGWRAYMSARLAAQGAK